MRTRDPFRSARAQSLRAQSTDAERKLWGALRSRRLNGLKFVRQFPVAGYFADFACREHMLIVELDGGQHAESAYDLHRDEELMQQGYRVLRIWNADVFTKFDEVRETILAAVERRLAPYDQYKTPDRGQ